MNKKIKLVFKYILLFGLCLISFALLGTIFLKLTILNKNYIIKRMDKINYYDSLYEEIRTDMNYYTAPSGFEEDIFDDTFSKEDIKKDMNYYLENIYSGNKTDIDTSNFTNKLDAKIDEFIKSKNFKVINYDEVHKFSQEMAKIYVKRIKINNYSEKLMNKLNKVNKLINNLIIIFIFYLLICLYLYKKIYKEFNISTILYFNTFMLFFLNIFIKNKIDIKHIFILNKSFTKLILSIINSNLRNMLIIGILFFVLGVFLNTHKKTKLS